MMNLTRWFARSAGLVLLVSSLSCGNDLAPRVPANIVIVPNQPVVSQGLTPALTATVVDAAGKAIGGRVVTFSSSDTLTATVSAAGVVTSRGPLGTARITAALGGLTNFVDITIEQRIVGLGVTPNPLLLNTQLSAQLNVAVVDFEGNPVFLPSTASFSSSQPSIAQVGPTGVVTSPGVVTGSATITVQADTFVVLVPVTVTQIPTVLTVTPNNVVMAPSTTQQLSSAVTDLAGRAIAGLARTYASSAPAVFTVSSAGLITAGSTPGSGTIVIAADSLRDTISVFVGTAPPGTILQTTPVPGSGYAAAVASNGALIVSLAGTNSVVTGTIQSLGFSDTVTVNSQPLGVATNPAGTIGYVALNGGSTIATVNLGSGVVTVAPFVPAGGTVLSVLASSDGQLVFVGTDSWLYKLSASTLTTLDSIAVSVPLHLAAHPTQSRIYASLQGTGYVEEIDITTMDSLRTFGPGSTIQAVAVAADGSTLYVANEGANRVTSFDLATGSAGLTFTTAGGAFGLVVDGTVLYATSSLSGIVEAFDRASAARLYAKSVGGAPRRPAVAPGGILVVPNEGGWVDFIR